MYKYIHVQRSRAAGHLTDIALSSETTHHHSPQLMQQWQEGAHQDRRSYMKVLYDTSDATEQKVGASVHG